MNIIRDAKKRLEEKYDSCTTEDLFARLDEESDAVIKKYRLLENRQEDARK